MKDDIYMDNYADAYFDLYVLMTTANFPDVMYAMEAEAQDTANRKGAKESDRERKTAKDSERERSRLTLGDRTILAAKW